MPTTITSAGVTFNDTTTLTSANIGTAQLVNGSVTAAKLGTTEQKQIAKAWVNFNGALIASNEIGPVGTSLVVAAGSNQGTWNFTGAWSSQYLGVKYFLNIGGSNATLGGVNVSTIGIQINNIISANQATFTLLAGPAISSQTVNGNGASTGYLYSATGIRSSYNVSSVTKNAVGDYTLNFATPMADANYSWNAGGNNSDDLATGGNSTVANTTTANQTASALRIQTRFQSTNVSGIADMSLITLTVFGN